ncbi:MAG: protein kinase domain-containing protein, partial [Bacteroidota bacterium]
MNNTHHELPTGTLLHNRYRIESVIEQGGFGITYKALDQTLSRPVCIKELFLSGHSTRGAGNTIQSQGLKDLNFEHFCDRFIEEAGALARFRHQGIVQVLDVFRENGTAYCVMEYIKGETLKDKIQREGRLPLPKALPLMQAVLDATEEVHRQGMLHRDIKPDNIMLREDGSPVLIDFGSARAFSDAKTITQTAILTPGYAPPEQYSEKARRGSFTDIYALGATFYFMLTGVRPDEATLRHLNQLAAPHHLNADIPVSLSSAIMLALNLKPEDRFQDVQSFKEAIREAHPGNCCNPSSLRYIKIAAAVLLVLFVLLGVKYCPVSKQSKTTVNSLRLDTLNPVIRQLLNNMVLVEGGTFKMGCTPEQGLDCSDIERPVHQVQVNSYRIGKYEVTQAEWEAVMGSNPSEPFYSAASSPVQKVSWEEIQVFIYKLNTISGLEFRLPTEAEWEFAARGGNKSKGYKYSGGNSIGAIGWYQENAGRRLKAVGLRIPNELGIYDMSGNVWE